MACLKVGWIACQKSSIFVEIEKIKHYTSICNSAHAEIISLIALGNKDKILARNSQIVDRNLKLLNVFMLEYKDKFSWVKPQGGCVGLVKYKSDQSIEVFCQNLIESKGVLLMPDSLYDLGENYFHIRFGRVNMPEALIKFEEFLA